MNSRSTRKKGEREREKKTVCNRFRRNTRNIWESLPACNRPLLHSRGARGVPAKQHGSATNEQTLHRRVQGARKKKNPPGVASLHSLALLSSFAAWAWITGFGRVASRACTPGLTPVLGSSMDPHLYIGPWVRSHTALITVGTRRRPRLVR